MDTSEQYIKMCDCEEVQDVEPGHVGDYRYSGESDWDRDSQRFVLHYWILLRTDDGDAVVCIAEYESGEERAIFLPRQDQIQEWMNYCFWDVMLENFIEFYDGGYVSEIGFLSMEQFWLAFYMHEKHGKVWNGDEWAKSDGAKGLGKVSKESSSTVTRER